MISRFYILYVKTHNKTKLKYLGKTCRNPFTYHGSGLYWRRHLKIHGNDVTTEIVGVYETKGDLRKGGKYYSKVWNIVKSKKWANLAPEEGDGAASGCTPWNKGKRYKSGILAWNSGKKWPEHSVLMSGRSKPEHSIVLKQKYIQGWSPRKGKTHSPETKELIRKSKLGKKPSLLTRQKMSETHKQIWSVR